MDYTKLFTLATNFYKLAQVYAVEANPGAYQDVLNDAGLWGERGQQKVLSALEKAKAHTIVDVLITVNPDLSVKFKLEGQHPNLLMATKLLQASLADSMSNALKQAVKQQRVGAPDQPTTWTWITGIGFEL